MTLYQKPEFYTDFKSMVGRVPPPNPYQKPEAHRHRDNFYQKSELPTPHPTKLPTPSAEPKQSPLEKRLDEDDLMKKERTRRRGMGSGMGSRAMTNPNIPQPLQMK